MKDRLLCILKNGMVSSGLIVCRNNDERIYLKRYLSRDGRVSNVEPE